MAVLKSESSIATAVNTYATKLGVSFTKLSSDANTGDPDYVYWMPGGLAVLIEYKKEGGGELSPKQQFKIKLYTRLGYEVIVCDDAKKGREFIKSKLQEGIKISKERAKTAVENNREGDGGSGLGGPRKRQNGNAPVGLRASKKEKPTR